VAHTGRREIHTACGTYGEKRHTYSFLVGKTEGRGLLVKPRRRWKNNTKVYLPEIVSVSMTVIDYLGSALASGCSEHGDEISGSMK
jgi:hypothetical protein